MNNLLSKILILDCQTTGMHPKTGSLIQLGWCIFEDITLSSPVITKRTLKLPPDKKISHNIKKLLHLTTEDLAYSTEPKQVFAELQQVLQSLSSSPIVLAHYAQFEQSFLKYFYLEHTNQDTLNFQLFCLQKIAKKLLPNLPSYTLKALAGYFHLPDTTKNDVTSHVQMTYHIWQHLIPKLNKQGIDCYSILNEWLVLKKAHKKSSYYEYNIARLSRLTLSEKPGVYRMLSQDGTILYIGKASSLKARVNSYFRGIKNRNKRTLEMLTQVWDIKTIECDSPLEAALLESDEIKKYNPPYNMLLKNSDRYIIFYNKKYTNFADKKDSTFYNGPYKPFDSVARLIELLAAIKNRAKLPVEFSEEYSLEVNQQAWKLFCTTNYLNSEIIKTASLRDYFVIGYQLLKQFEQQHGKYNFTKWWLAEKKKQKLEPGEELPTEQYFAQKITRWFIRAAETKRRSIQLRTLFTTSLLIKATQKKLFLVNGELVDTPPHTYSLHTSPNFELAHYDRLSILLSAKNKKLLTFCKP